VNIVDLLYFESCIDIFFVVFSNLDFPNFCNWNLAFVLFVPAVFRHYSNVVSIFDKSQVCSVIYFQASSAFWLLGFRCFLGQLWGFRLFHFLLELFFPCNSLFFFSSLIPEWIFAIFISYLLYLTIGRIFSSWWCVFVILHFTSITKIGIVSNFYRLPNCLYWRAWLRRYPFRLITERFLIFFLFFIFLKAI